MENTSNEILPATEKKTYHRNRKRINKKRNKKSLQLLMGTWNVRSVHKPENCEILESELTRYHICIAALQEMWCTSSSFIEMKHYILITSGNQNTASRTGFMVRKDLKNVIIKYELVSSRICVLRIKGKFYNLSIISVHGPSEEADEEEKHAFYQKLGDCYDSLPRYDAKLIMGDLNAKIGLQETFRPVIGIHCGHLESNKNGYLLINFSFMRNLRISSTYFPHKGIHKATWVEPETSTASQVDHVLIDSRHASCIQNVRSYMGADCGSDHYLLSLKFLQRLSQRKSKANKNLDALNEKMDCINMNC